MIPKQHQFAREVVLGKSQTNAYRSAYNTLRMNDNSIRREASRLMDKPQGVRRQTNGTDVAII